MPATTSPATSNHSDAEKDRWLQSFLGLDFVSTGPAPGGKDASAARLAARGAAAPAGSSATLGKNFLSQLVLSDSAPIPGVPVGFGAGLGVGYGENNGQKQYYIVQRMTGAGTPKGSISIGAESAMSSSPILNRTDPSRAATFTAPSLKATGTAHTGPVATSAQIGATASHFSNGKVKVVFGGPTVTVSAKVPGAGNAALNLTGSTQFVDNWRRRPDPTDADALEDVQDGMAAERLGKRPIQTLNKNMPILVSSSATLSFINKPGAQAPLPFLAPIQSSVTWTEPVDDHEVPDWVKNLLQRIVKAQRSPNPKDLLRLLQDIEASPQLRKRLLDWELEELKHVPAPQPVPVGPHRPVHGPSLAPTLVPDPGWATRVGHSLRDAAANWRPPTPAQQAEAALATALAALGAFIVANPEILLVMAL